jgi:hypothetical protein
VWCALTNEMEYKQIPADSNIIMASLEKDAKRIGDKIGQRKDSRESTTEFVVRMYTIMRTALRSKPGYPRIYRIAWTHLIMFIRNEQWDLLRDIDEIYTDIGRAGSIAMTDTISHWHHKAVFYCWAYCIMAGDENDLSLGWESDIAKKYRSRMDANTLLSYVKTPTAFANITPDDAVSILTTFDNKIDGFQTLRPYLFRLSLTYPGQFVISYTKPYSTGVEHKHLTPKQIDSLLYDRVNFYKALLQIMLPKNDLKNYSVDQVFGAMKKLDSGVSMERLQKVLKGKRVIPKQEVYDYLQMAYLKHTQPNIRVPLAEEVLGVTDSYIDSYHTESLRRCFHCESPLSLSIREPLNNRIYCNVSCYNENCKTCF